MELFKFGLDCSSGLATLCHPGREFFDNVSWWLFHLVSYLLCVDVLRDNFPLFSLWTSWSFLLRPWSASGQVPSRSLLPILSAKSFSEIGPFCSERSSSTDPVRTFTSKLFRMKVGMDDWPSNLRRLLIYGRISVYYSPSR